ncbi:MAG: DUF2752 domain-containing protein [Oscillospiraceae bacterium]|nr:DUF2752 domain-containing protein [Oscillospiraceae bacterium]
MLVLAGASAAAAYWLLKVCGIPCLVKTLTGLYCPGCGMGRAFSALVQGNLLLAFRQNPAIFLVLPWVGLYCGARLADWAATGGNHIDRYVPDRLLLWVLIALFVFAIFRNIPLSCFDILRPIG